MGLFKPYGRYGRIAVCLRAICLNDGRLPLITINALYNAAVRGEPCRCFVEPEGLSPDLMQGIAAQNNLSETAFLVPSKGANVDFDLRWFTPTAEVPLCGHATLASVHALAQHFALRIGKYALPRKAAY